jgi:hypothetical protein
MIVLKKVISFGLHWLHMISCCLRSPVLVRVAFRATRNSDHSYMTIMSCLIYSVVMCYDGDREQMSDSPT